MKFLSVCSGISAASCAWRPLGWESVGFFEVGPYPSAILAHHYPNTPNYGDLTKHHEHFTASTRFDVLEGGTPCQGFSIAGLRKGMDDPRSQLAYHFVEIAARHRPRWLVWENVPGVFSSAGGADFAAFLGALTGRELSVPVGGWSNSGHAEGISSAYGVAWRVLDAQFAGVPQRRRRVFVVGYLGDWKRAAAVLFEWAGLRGDPAPSREARERIAPTLSASAKGGGGLGTDFDLDGGLIHDVSPSVTSKWAKGSGGPSGDECQNLLAVSPPLTTNPYGDHESREGLLVPETTHALTGEGFDASEDGSGRGTPLLPVAFDCKASGQIAVAFAQNTRDEVREMDVAGALAAQPGMKQQSYLRQGMAVRRLTPLECERLQGFPDGYTQLPKWNGWRAVDEDEDVEELQSRGFRVRVSKATGAARVNDPDGPRYKALGNSMAVPVMRWIGERIVFVEELEGGT